MTDTLVEQPDLFCWQHEDRPAVAVIVYCGQDESIGESLCPECSRCVGPHCGQPAVVREPEYGEPWCASCGKSYNGGEPVNGPDIVPVDSDRYRALVTQQTG